jgi:putative tricarboxylic transport membrane protein
MTRGGRATGELALGVALVILGVLLLVGTTMIAVAPTYSRVGPRVFPFAVGIGLIVVGLIYTFESWRGVQTPADDHQVRFLPVAFISAGLILDAVLLKSLGFIPASTLLFVLVTAGMGSRRHLRDLIAGAVLSTIAYLTFVYGLGLSLPAGVLRGWF